MVWRRLDWIQSLQTVLSGATP
ncbi:protein of unknown function [Burkholderia multivorans]